MFENYGDFCDVFSKMVKDKVLCFLLVKAMGKDFSYIGIWNNTVHPYQNYGPSKLPFCFTDPYISHPN